MPVIPRYSTPEVDSVGLATPRAQGLAPDAFGGKLAQTLDSTSGKFFELARLEKQKTDKAALDGATAELLTTTNTLVTDALGRVGTDAIGGRDSEGKEIPDVARSSLEAYDKSYGEIMNRLTNEEQKSAFRHTATAHRSTMEKSVLAHVIDQREKVRVKQTESLLAAQISSAGLAQSQDDRAKALDDVQQTMSDLYRQYPEEVYNEKRDEVWSKLHEYWLAEDARKNPAQALKDFEEAKKNGDLRPDAVARLEEKLKHTSVKLLAQTEATSVWTEMGPAAVLNADPKKYRGNIDLVPIEIAKMEQKIRDKYPDNPELVDAAIARLRSTMEGVEKERGQRRDYRTDTIYNRLAEEGLGAYSDIISSDEYLSLDGKDQKAFKAAVETEKRIVRAEKREIVAQAKRDQEDKRLEFLSTLTPDMLLNTTESDLRGMTKALGAQYVNKLISDRRTLLKDQDALKLAKADDTMLRDIAFQSGLDFAYQPKSKDQKVQMGMLKDRVQESMRVEQLRTGQKLNDEQQRQIIRDQLLKVSVNAKWGIFNSTSEKYQFQAEYPENYSIPGASGEDVKTVVAAFRAVGISRPTFKQVQDGVKELKKPKGGRRGA